MIVRKLSKLSTKDLTTSQQDHCVQWAWRALHYHLLPPFGKRWGRLQDGRRMAKELESKGRLVGWYRVRRLMRELKLRAKTPRRYKVTTDSNHSFCVSANIVDRQFKIEAPNKVWTADIITYLWTLEGGHILQ